MSGAKAATMSGGATRSVSCPICHMNLSFLAIAAREQHADDCAENLINGHSFESASPTETPTEKLSLGPDDSLDIKDNLEPLELQQHPPESVHVKSEPNDAALLEPAAASVKRSSINEDSVSADTVATKKRFMPFYKVLRFEDRHFAVDAFNYGSIDKVSSYFLTHFHSDHYGGLSKKWTAGPIYCSPATARLTHTLLKVPSEYLIPVELNVETEVEGVRVLFLEANHCPGAVLILFNGHTLHTGDFRAAPDVLEDVQKHAPRIPLRALYLDTTYLDPKRSFPSQKLVIEASAEYCHYLQHKPPARSFFTAVRETRILVMVGTYTIGKERLAVEVARKLGSKIWTTARKRKTLELLGDPALNEFLDIENGLDCQVHLTSMNELSIAKLEEQWKFLKKHFTHLVAFIPTGWTFHAKEGRDGTQYEMADVVAGTKVEGFIHLCRVPYSEHSSFRELHDFCQGLPSSEIIATVRGQHNDMLRAWERP